MFVTGASNLVVFVNGAPRDEREPFGPFFHWAMRNALFLRDWSLGRTAARIYVRDMLSYSLRGAGC
jgi:hypothetical protein